MNPRIKELAERSGIEWDEKYHYFVSAATMRLFAQSVAQECADLYTHDDVMAPVGQSAWGEAYQDGWIEGTKAYRETILEHFGVE
jgi:hypothetical protein